MVQKAINEEIIKYQKTLLVWSEPLCSDIPNMFNSQEEINQKKREINHKLELMKQALISILVANPEGVSLAQLPAYIKKKLHFNYSLPELGFAKLKDLILSMGDEIKIDNKSNNHPYAVLINPEAYHKGYPSSEDFHAIPNQFPGYANYGRQSSDMSIPTRMIHGSKDYEMHNHKYNNSYSMTPTNYYPMFSNFQQHNELRRNQSSSSFQSADKFNPNANGNDSFYVPQATSLYGTQVNQPQLNISHCRNNTGSDIGYENNFPIFSGKLKQNNLSQDYSQYPSFNGKVWQPIEAKEELIEVNSSLFLSENSSNFGFDRSRSISPKQHERIVSNLNNPNFGGIDQKFVTPNSIAERFSEEEKTETKRQGSISCDFKEVTNATEAPQQAKPTVQKQIHPNTAHNHSKLVPTSKIFLPSNKSKAPQKQAETFNQEIKSVSRLKAKADQN